MSACGICSLDNLIEVEVVAASTLAGEADAPSWLALGQRFGVNRQSLKNHMEKHYSPVPSATEQALDGLDELVATTVEELMAQMSFAPPELKPFYAVAIQNLRGLDQTKPSQQNLIAALKAITEVTGMKMEQRLMLEFGKQMFGLQPAAAPAGELADPNIIDVD